MFIGISGAEQMEPTINSIILMEDMRIENKLFLRRWNILKRLKRLSLLKRSIGDP